VPTSLTKIPLAEKDVEAGDDDEVPETPSKKAKTSVKEEPSEEASDHGADGFGINGNHFDNAMGSH
jgi:hypothetical protein